MGEEEAATDVTAALGAISWLFKRKLLFGIAIGIFLAPVLNRSTELVLDRVIPRETPSVGELAGDMPQLLLQAERLEVLSQLVQDRHILDGDSGCRPTLEFVQALNRVPLLFAGNTDVTNS